ncbi:MAG: helix-turn-helix domain-containing protein [Nibricoccus sp.]
MQSIGERLEEARKRKGLSIREASEATKIRSDYLHKFESNQFDINLPEIYVKGFLRTYANFLKAPSEKIINDYVGLGLGDNKGPRQINREVYGRMDLSVGSKMEKESKEPTPAAPGGEQVATNADAAPRNPATFVPPRTAPSGFPIRRDVMIIGGAFVLGLALVIMLGFWLFGGRSSKQAAATPNATANADTIWVRPQPGEVTLPLIATGAGAVNVTVSTQRDNTILYQGTIRAGEQREVPRRGALKIISEPYQNLLVEIAGQRWPMQGRESTVRAP